MNALQTGQELKLLKVHISTYINKTSEIIVELLRGLFSLVISPNPASEVRRK
jgi:hypothetical protein